MAKPRQFRLVSPVAPEDDLHEATARMLRVLLAPPGECSPDGTVWYSVEHRNARDAVEGANRKRRGVVAGIADMHVFHRGKPLLIELKTRVGVLSAAQRARHEALAQAGVTVVVCRSLGSVQDALTRFGVRLRGRIAA